MIKALMALGVFIFLFGMSTTAAYGWYGCSAWVSDNCVDKTKTCTTSGGEAGVVCNITCTQCGSINTGACGDVCGPSGPPPVSCTWTVCTPANTTTPGSCTITADISSACTNCILGVKNQGGGDLLNTMKGFNHTLFDSCSAESIVAYWCKNLSAGATSECNSIKTGVCASSCGGSTAPPTSIPTSTPTPTLPGAFTTKFRIAENPTDLASASWQNYTTTVASTPFDYTFKDQTPGPKSIFVEFEDSAGKKAKHTAHIQLLGPDPAMTNCSLSFENNSTVLNLTGQNFGTTKGSVKSGETNLQVREWKETSIKAVWQNTPIGQTIPVSLTTSDGQTGDGQCGAISQLSLGAKVFCRAPSNHDIDNVDLTLIGAFEGGETVKQKVKIDKNGVIQGLTQKLETGKNYKLSLKAPRSLRRAVSFTAGPGTINISNFVLPIGDIFPVDGGDNVVNGFDKAELNRQFIISQDACSRSGDFNKDCRVNSIDWACMRYDYGQADDPEPVPGEPLVPSPNLSPNPSLSPSSSLRPNSNSNTNLSPSPTPSPSGTACIQVITPAKNPDTGECKNFPTPCDVPTGWQIVASCSTN